MLWTVIVSLKVRRNRDLCVMILSIWSWSLLQFTLVLTATRERKDRSGVLNRKTVQITVPGKGQGCCTPDVYGIIISIMLQAVFSQFCFFALYHVVVPHVQNALYFRQKSARTLVHFIM